MEAESAPHAPVEPQAAPGVEAPAQAQPKAPDDSKEPRAVTAEPGSTTVSVASESLQADTFYAVGNQTNVYVAAGQARQTRATFEKRGWTEIAAQKISLDEESELRATVVLRSRRLLVVAGEAELGKATLA